MMIICQYCAQLLTRKTGLCYYYSEKMIICQDCFWEFRVGQTAKWISNDKYYYDDVTGSGDGENGMSSNTYSRSRQQGVRSFR